MNYGYEDPSEDIKLDKEDESNRYSIQLYHRLAAAVNLKDKSVLEIGCGRGGGLAYVAKTFSPSQALGIDLEKRAVNFANKHHQLEMVQFKQGDAQKIPVEADSYDALLNVESSHRYLDMRAFISEVSRVLKNGGHFLYTDFRYPHEMEELREILNSGDFTLIEEQMINNNVIEALNLDSQRRESLVKKLMPGVLRKSALNFAGVSNTETYKQIESGELVYYVFIMQKSAKAA